MRKKVGVRVKLFARVRMPKRGRIKVHPAEASFGGAGVGSCTTQAVHGYLAAHPWLLDFLCIR